MSAPAPTSPWSYFIWTIGCQMNDADAARLGAELEARGGRPAATAAAADVVVLNTCVVRQQAEDKVYGRLGWLRGLKAARPALVLAVMGCLVGRRVAADLAARFPFVDLFLPPSAPEPLLALLAARGLVAAAPAPAVVLPPLPPSQAGQAVTAFVPVVLGCSHGCAFCVIPGKRGPERSRPAAAVVAEVRALVDRGIREVTLLGQIVDRYGLDLPGGPDLAGLLTQLQTVPGLVRLRFLTSHPRYFSERLLEAVATLPGVCPHFEIPLQAASDAVLAAMRRGYTYAEFRDLIGRLRARLPDAGINTDIIVGFCGETTAQFDETCRALTELQFDQVHIAKYSPRPGTPAGRHLADDVPAAEKERRRATLDALQRELLVAKNRQWLDRDVAVLVEGRVKGRWRGRTPQHRLVFFADDRDLAGRLLAVRIQQTGAYALQGVAADRVTTLHPTPAQASLACLPS